MASIHPGENQLHKYLNKRLSELEHQRVGHHLRQCRTCRRTLGDLLDMELMLDQLPALQAPDRITERVMLAIAPEAGSRATAAEDESVRRENRGKNGRSRELTNGLIATAATYLFVSTGIMGKLIALDANQLEAGFQQSVMDMARWIATISRQWLF